MKNSRIEKPTEARYMAPEVTVIELAVEQGFSASVLDKFDDTNADDNVTSLDKWTGWED